MLLRLSLLFALSLLHSLSIAQEVEPSWWERFFNPFMRHSPRFVGNQFFSVDKQLNLSDVEGTAECFGDFNNDRYTDLIILSSNKKTIYLFIWETSTWSFRPHGNVTITAPSSTFTIDGISAVDINYDGRLDLLVQGHNQMDPAHTIALWYSGNLTAPHLVFEAVLPQPSIGQFVIIDYNSDLLPDLQGQSHDGNAYERFVYLNNPAARGNFTYVAMNAEMQLPPSHSFPSVHSNSFVDLDGDCLADLILAAKRPDSTIYYTIFLNKQGSYHLYRNLSSLVLPPGSGQLTFADVDGDGNLDFVFPVCLPGGGDCSKQHEARVLYNKQLKLCDSIFSRSGCRAEDNLCQADDNFTFVNPLGGAGEDLVIVTLPSDECLFEPGGLSSQSRLRLGDYNLDGYPDLIASSVVPTPQGKEYRLRIYQNVACFDASTATSTGAEFGEASGGCTAEAIAAGRRTFQSLASDTLGEIHTTKGLFSAAFFDLDHDGTNDVIAMSYDNHTGQARVHGFFNNLNNDASFFITIGLNGLCTQWCPDNVLPYPKPYIAQYGTTIKFAWTSMEGHSRVYALAQLSQTAYAPLHTPYTLNGIARPANYINYFFLGVPIYINGSTSTHWHTWPGLIPNSQIVVITYPHGEPDKWMPELYLNPSGATVWIIVSAVVTVMVSGLIVMVFSYIEKKQDDEEKKSTEHVFSFKTL